MADVRSIVLMHEAAALFREYERHHRAKITEAGRPEKAERNRDIAERIEAALAMENQLELIVRSFIDQQQITCSETIYQTDRVIENAFEFIERLCDVVGYAEPDQ